MRQDDYDRMEANPVIAAVKDEAGLERACRCENIQVIFLLFGDLCSVPRLTDGISRAGKQAIVHLDLIGGLASREAAVNYVKKYTSAKGIISTKPALVKRGRELGLLTVLRIFLLDSMALMNIEKQLQAAKPDFIEILPGVMPKIIRRVVKDVRVPVIAGGLISDREDVMAALSAGALCVSTTAEDVWNM